MPARQSPDPFPKSTCRGGIPDLLFFPFLRKIRTGGRSAGDPDSTCSTPCGRVPPRGCEKHRCFLRADLFFRSRPGSSPFGFAGKPVRQPGGPPERKLLHSSSNSSVRSRGGNETPTPTGKRLFSCRSHDTSGIFLKFSDRASGGGIEFSWWKCSRGNRYPPRLGHDAFGDYSCLIPILSSVGLSILPVAFRAFFFWNSFNALLVFGPMSPSSWTWKPALLSAC